MAPLVAAPLVEGAADPSPQGHRANLRTLLLSPPSLSSHPELLNGVLSAHDRASTDIQMLDRLSLNLVQLPESTYERVLVLTDADGTRSESKKLLSASILNTIVRALQPGGRLARKDGTIRKNDQKES